MNKSKKIDLVCLFIVALTLIVTFLFINGEKFGLIKSGNNNVTSIIIEDDNASISGNGAKLEDGTIYILKGGEYVLSGNSDTLNIEVNAKKEEVSLILDSLNLSGDNLPLINIKKAGNATLTLKEDSVNYLNYNGEKAAILSEYPLTLTGSGSLNIDSLYHCIKGNETLTIEDGNYDLKCLKDGIHSSGDIIINGSTIHVETEDDGIHSDAAITISDADISITKAYEGIEGDSILINGGNINIQANDDGINAMQTIEINEGNITILNGNGIDADGIDSNGDIIINGGNINIQLFGNNSNCALDVGSESQGKLLINGGFLLATGGSMMQSAADQSSSQYCLNYSLSLKAGDEIMLKNGNEVIYKANIVYDASNIMLSMPNANQDTKLYLNGNEASSLQSFNQQGIPQHGFMGNRENKAFDRPMDQQGQFNKTEGFFQKGPANGPMEQGDHFKEAGDLFQKGEFDTNRQQENRNIENNLNLQRNNNSIVLPLIITFICLIAGIIIAFITV